MDIKIALITGANKGLGFESARILGQKGFRVYIGARDKKRGEEAAAALKKEGFDARFLQLDVTSDSSVTDAAKQLAEQEKHLDVLINNAGIALLDRDGKGSVSTIEVMKETYEVNVFGPFRVTKAFLPLLKNSKQASVVMVSSGLGSVTLHADPNSWMATVEAIAYNSSKTALNGVMIGFANEFKAYGIKVNSVNPGYNATDLNNNQGTYPPTHGAGIIVKAAHLDSAGPTGTFVDQDQSCPW
ncbi:SDR family oxidoreductase [Bdellovibrio sp. SKB1291214]|uniref:SDR family oxidoreductase n=1 Tax=Bdellovibrio sp. SKB1291214 TaxID=1732569 RepID=UPI000B51C7B8|nr:SDR family oxidoreductase [Bdellovibrio sp. SKB1291214]UYL09446.1 SDR family oxidoreductase [Bdellovibrio sp. SKB1291214]